MKKLKKSRRLDVDPDSPFLPFPFSPNISSPFLPFSGYERRDGHGRPTMRVNGLSA